MREEVHLCFEKVLIGGGLEEHRDHGFVGLGIGAQGLVYQVLEIGILGPRCLGLGSGSVR